MRKLLTIFLFIPALMLGACASGEEEHADQPAGKEKAEEHAEHGEMALADIREETSGADVLPEFLKDKPENMQMIYQAVALNGELLEQMPCYCGCGESVGHKNNYDCFIHEDKEDGAVVWDDHGTKCNVCLEIAVKSINDLNDGKSPKEIRKEVDETYKEGYAEPTPTKEI